MVSNGRRGGTIGGPVYNNQSCAPIDVTYLIQSDQSDVKLSLTFDELDLSNGSMSIYDGVNQSARLIISLNGM